MDTLTRTELRVKSILATKARYSYDVLKDDDILRRGSRGYSNDIKQIIIDKQDTLIVNFLNNPGEYSCSQVANALGLNKDLVKNKLQKLSAQGKITRIKLDKPTGKNITVLYRGL